MQKIWIDGEVGGVGSRRPRNGEASSRSNSTAALVRLGSDKLDGEVCQEVYFQSYEPRSPLPPTLAVTMGRPNEKKERKKFPTVTWVLALGFRHRRGNKAAKEEGKPSRGDKPTGSAYRLSRKRRGCIRNWLDHGAWGGSAGNRRQKGGRGGRKGEIACQAELSDP